MQSVLFSIPASILKTKQKASRGDGFPQALDLRAHRTISWLAAAESMKADSDVCFILLWVGFNAAYADGDAGPNSPGDRKLFKQFLAKLSRFDKKSRVQDATWNRYRAEIESLICSKYLFSPFWMYQNGAKGFDDWSIWFDRSRSETAFIIRQRDTAKILAIVFDCLYVLRNQLLHGGTTWKSSVNRRQVEDGLAVISWMLPLFVDIMLENPGFDWGEPFYPVVEKLPYCPSASG